MENAPFSDDFNIPVETLHSKNNTSLNFRFLCQNNVAESRLSDAIIRTWRELSSLFPHLPVSIDFNNAYNLSRYPLNPKHKGHLTEWLKWERDVVIQGSYIGVNESFSGPTHLLDEGLFKRLYLEQFVFNLGVFIMGPSEHIQDIESMLLNLLQNTNVDGVTLLSLEESISPSVAAINIEKILPEENSRCIAQPVFGFQRQPCKKVSCSELGWTNDEIGKRTRKNWFADALILPVSVMSPDNDDVIISDKILLEDTTIVIQNAIGDQNEGMYGDSPCLLGFQSEDGFDYPLWVVFRDETNETTYLNRITDVPRFSRAEETMLATRAYPASTKFDMRCGAEYQIMLLLSDNEAIAELVASGLSISREVLPDGKVRFTIGMQNDIICAPIFEGSEVMTEAYLEKLSSEHVGELTMDDLLSISNEMGCTINLESMKTTKQ